MLSDNILMLLLCLFKIFGGVVVVRIALTTATAAIARCLAVDTTVGRLTVSLRCTGKTFGVFTGSLNLHVYNIHSHKHSLVGLQLTWCTPNIR